MFDAGSEDITKILDVGWRTASLCAHETYMDCPYYEQLQYVGDTRTQCLISIFNTGDARLMRNAIDLINDSRQSDGATMSRYPSRLEQYIPGFSLWWIGMLHDYWWYVDDPEFVTANAAGRARGAEFLRGLSEAEWVAQCPAVVALFRLGALVAQWRGAAGRGWLIRAIRSAADDRLRLGRGSRSQTGTSPRWRTSIAGREQQLRQTVQQLYWDPARQMYADTPRKQKFSQHTNTLAVLGGVIAGPPAHDLMLRILSEPGIAQATFFFRFYLHQALRKVGEGNRYLDLLDDWRGMIDHGLTTFAEWEERPNDPPRSDCHAWSASPNIEIFRTVLGVDSAAPGFSRVSVRPNLGAEAGPRLGASPERHGVGRVYAGGKRLVGQCDAPRGVSGTFEWLGRQRLLTPGANQFVWG